MKQTLTTLYGLVLAGGKSTRMGRDKGLIAYYDIPQRLYLYQLLEKVCEKTFMSIREDQFGEMEEGIQCIIDENIYEGPYNGILSAHHAYPKVAWLVLATDLPFVDEKSLKDLIKARNPEKVGTTYTSRENPLPEPLFAIWESHGLREGEQYMKETGSISPRKFLREKGVELVYPRRKEILFNANKPEDFEYGRSEIK